MSESQFNETTPNRKVAHALAQQIDAEPQPDDDVVEGAPGEFIRPVTPHQALSQSLALLQDLIKAREIQRSMLHRKVRDIPMVKMTRDGEAETGVTNGQFAERVLPDIEFDIAEIVARVVPLAAKLGVNLPRDLQDMHRAGTINGTGM